MGSKYAAYFVELSPDLYIRLTPHHSVLTFTCQTDSWADSQLLFGNINWNPGPNDQKYCSWDFAKQKNCNYHKYDEGEIFSIAVQFFLRLPPLTIQFPHATGLISLVHAAGAEIFPSLGGWTLSDAFVGMAASATSRKRFADCVELIQDYDFDGKRSVNVVHCTYI